MIDHEKLIKVNHSASKVKAVQVKWSIPQLDYHFASKAEHARNCVCNKND